MARWRKLHKEEFHDFYSSTSIIRMITLRRRRRKNSTGYAA
jgi:hypothetical protein